MFIIKPNPLSPQARAGRTAAGVIMITAAFFTWGKWVVAGLGALLIVSAWIGSRAAGSGGCGCCRE